MPNTNDGPAGSETDKATPAADASPLPGFAEAFAAMGPPSPGQGQPEQVEAVETSETVEPPKAEADTPAKEPAKAADKAPAAETINFDGFSDESKAYWETAHKAGHATAADVKRAREESLFQSAWSKKTTALAKDKEAFEAEKTKVKENLDLLHRVQTDPVAYAAWKRLLAGDVPADDSASGDLVDAKKADEIARKAYQAEKTAEAQASAKQTAEFTAKKNGLQAVVTDIGTAFGLKPETMNTYLEKFAEDFPEGVDPIRYAVENLSPAELRRGLTLIHKAEAAEAKAKALSEQVSQRASKASQASKQSQPPARRTTETNGSLDPVSRLNADLGLAPDWSNVTGFGHPVNGR